MADALPRSVVVVGAGISGLSAAYRIRAALPGASVRVLESAPRPGGNIWTDREDGYTLEHGPNGFLDSKPSTRDLCRDLGLEPELIAASEGSRKNRYLFWKNELHRLPNSPMGLLRTPILSFLGKLRLLSEPLRRSVAPRGVDESIDQFAIRRFGRETAETILDALVTGIHGGDSRQLSIAAAFPRLVNHERTSGSVVRGVLRAGRAKRAAAKAAGEPRPGPTIMWSFRGGLRVLIDRLAQELGPNLHLNCPTHAVQRTPQGWRIQTDSDTFDATDVVLTCPSTEQARLLQTTDPGLSSLVSEIVYTPIAVALMGYREADTAGPLDGFGYIAPQRSQRDALGVQWCSSIFPERAPPGFVLWRVLCGGMSRPDLLEWSDEFLLRILHEELEFTMGVRAAPVFTRLIRWPQAIPQYRIGHPARVSAIMTAAKAHPGLWLGGNAYHGVAMNDCTDQANQIATQIATRTV